MFSVPNGPSVANFGMWIDGVELIGEVVEKERAQQICESYKLTRLASRLLEQVDFKIVGMRIFSIAVGAEQGVQISYFQQLDMDADRVTYVYSLTIVTHRGMSQHTAGRFAFNTRVLSDVPIVEIDSPSHGDDFVIAKHIGHFHEASLETNGGNLSRDVVLSYRMSCAETGFDLITSTPEGEDG